MSNEWYTPSKYIEAARQVMGSIDLDPASCELANQTVKATTYYSKEQDGLALPWYGNVWLNPPYITVEKIGLQFWAKRMRQEYEQEHIEQGILLLPVPQYITNWFINMWDYLVCYPLERVKFYNPSDGMRHTAVICLFYFGSHEQKFIDVFSQFGTIARAVRTGVLV